MTVLRTGDSLFRWSLPEVKVASARKLSRAFASGRGLLREPRTYIDPLPRISCKVGVTPDSLQAAKVAEILTPR